MSSGCLASYRKWSNYFTTTNLGIYFNCVSVLLLVNSGKAFIAVASLVFEIQTLEIPTL